MNTKTYIKKLNKAYRLVAQAEDVVDDLKKCDKTNSDFTRDGLEEVLYLWKYIETRAEIINIAVLELDIKRRTK